MFDLGYLRDDKRITQTFLARGHLAPAADGIFKSWQLATYFYINAIPQWQKINNGKWKRLEQLIRKNSINFDKKLTVYTGVDKELKLPDLAGNMETLQISMNVESITVPKFIWKIIKYEGSAIAFVNLNSLVEDTDRANQRPTNQDLLDDLEATCKVDICATAESESVGRWPIKNRTKASTGYIVCCRVNSALKEKLPNIPDEALESSNANFLTSQLCNFSNLNCKRSLPQN